MIRPRETVGLSLLLGCCCFVFGCNDRSAKWSEPRTQRTDTLVAPVRPPSSAAHSAEPALFAADLPATPIRARAIPSALTPVSFQATPVANDRPSQDADVHRSAIETLGRHSPDYRELVGELQFSGIRNVWRLRYASAEDNDRYGGSVTLVDLASNASLTSGVIVRVEGSLLDPNSLDPSPLFCVKTMRVVATR